MFLAVAAKGHFGIGSLVSAWAHEANRIFRDRLVGSESQAQFDSMPIAFSAIVWWVPNHRTSFTRCCDVVIQNNNGPRIERFSLIFCHSLVFLYPFFQVKSKPVDLDFQIESDLYCFGGFFNMICYVFQSRVSGDRCNLGRFFRSVWCESGSRVFRASLTKCGRTKCPEVKETRKQMEELSQLFGTKA